MNNANICILPDDGLSGPKHAEWNNRIICLWESNPSIFFKATAGHRGRAV
jgi:hypothetical protein